MTATTLSSLPAIRSYSYWVSQYRRTWRGSVVSTVVSPVLYLAAMGLGLGSIVHRSPSLGGLTYLQFIGPGLLAATAMQVGAGESTYPVLASFKWLRLYHAMAATPLLPVDILVGHLLWMATRITMASTVYLAVVWAFGGVASPWAVLALPACLLTGLAFAVPITAFSSSRDSDSGFAALNRFVVVPMFLFSGVFFPVSQLPEALRWVAYATPLWHGVDLARALTTGDVRFASAIGHVGYLAAFSVVGFVIALRIYRRKLEV
jgi:lipooligosaccharide transport system permease protein